MMVLVLQKQKLCPVLCDHRLCLTEMCHNKTFIFWILKLYILYKCCQSFGPLFLSALWDDAIKPKLVSPWLLLDLTAPFTLSLQIQTLSYFDSVLRKLPVEVSTKTIIYHNAMSPLIDFSNDFRAELIPDFLHVSSLNI